MYKEFFFATVKAKVWSLESFSSKLRKIYSARIKVVQLPYLSGWKRLKNTLPYDNAAGSYRNTNLSLDDGKEED
ncbi:MAG: hypothetical protein IPO63_13135 [Bacteroidetes bacterium]|nr:hypothetical protein [Bacteroidota bacterium]